MRGELAKIFKEFGAWFERQQRVLPWRDQPTLYRVWVSEIMLQQTQVITVVPYFERFIAKFPDVHALARATEAEVTAQWAGLGYYSRARNLRKGAIAIEAEGRFPATRAEWLEIPGVGDYTAGAILSIAQNLPEPILDGNVERVLSRVRRVSRARGDAAFKSRLWRISRIFVERAHDVGVAPRVLNQGLMELGAMICAPKRPRCLLCPLAAICRGRAHGDAEAFPPRKAPKQWVIREESLSCVIDGAGRVLLRERGPGEWRAGLWDLVEAPLPGARKLGEVNTRHVVTRHKILRRTEVYRASDPNWGVAEAAMPTAPARWFAREELGELGVGSALVKTLAEVEARYPGLLAP